MDFLESQTIINLARVFAGECQDGARYQFIADTANQEKQHYIYDVLKDLAANEMAHAKKVFELITTHSNEVVKNINIEAGYPFKSGKLVDTIKFELENERSEAESVYPAFAEIARDEGYNDAYTLLNLISKVENTHVNILTELYEGLKANKLYKCNCAVKWKCNNCGHVAEQKAAWTTCPLCGNDQGYVRINLKNTSNCTNNEQTNKK